MERKAGFRECPKCGLRNKPSAAQCDFCGQSLGQTEDWQLHIKDLESLNRMELRRSVDQQTSKRIEATIIRKEIPSKSVEVREASYVGKALMDLDDGTTKTDRAPLGPKERRCEPRSSQESMGLREVGRQSLPAKEVGRIEERALTLKDVPPETLRTLDEMLKEPLIDVRSATLGTSIDDGNAHERDLDDGGPHPAGSVEVEHRSLATETLKDISPSETEKPVEPSENEIKTSVIPEEGVSSIEDGGREDELVIPGIEQAFPSNPAGSEVPAVEEEVLLSSNTSNGTIKLKLVAVERRDRPRSLPMVSGRPIRMMIGAISLLIGSLSYMTIIALISLQELDSIIGLGWGAASSFMIVAGALVAYPYLVGKEDDEVFICPKCHEKVGRGSVVCPACGVEFENGE